MLRATRTSILAAVTMMTVAPGLAGATGFLVARFGGEHGTPMATNPTAIYFNPAGIALARGTRVYLEGFFVYRQLTYDRPEGAVDHPGKTPGSPDPTVNTGEGGLHNFLVSPFIGVTSDLGVDHLGIGLSFSTPFGGQASFDKVDKWEGNTMYPGAVDGPQRWHQIEGEIRSSYVSAAGAYEIPSANLAVGIGANLVISTIKSLRATSGEGTDDVVQSGGLLEGRAYADVSDLTFSLGVGLQWRPVTGLVVGLSYQSQPGFGEMSLSGTLTRRTGVQNTMVDDVDFRQALPDVIRAGASYLVTPQLEVRLFGSFERWSTFEKQCIMLANAPNKDCRLDDKGRALDAGVVINNIPRDWGNGFTVRAGASYFASSELELLGGLGFDSNVVPDKTMEISLHDQNDVQVTVGATYALLDQKLHLSASLLAVIGLGVDPAPRTRLSNGDLVSPYEGETRVPDGAGKYSIFTGVLQVGAEYRF